MPGVDYAPDPRGRKDTVLTHAEEGRVGLVPTAAQIAHRDAAVTQWDREQGLLEPAGSPQPRVVDFDRDAQPGEQPGNPRVRDYMAGSPLDNEIAELEDKLMDLKFKREQLTKEKTDVNVRERAAPGQSVFPDRARAAEEQDITQQHKDTGSHPDRAGGHQEQGVSPRADDRGKRQQSSERRQPDQRRGQPEEKGEPQVPGPAGTRGIGDAGER